MNAHELFSAGRLAEAIDAQLADVKANPGDQSKRLFLFELSAFGGDLDRATRQLEALKYEEMELQMAAQHYRNLLESERKRRLVFQEGTQPKFLFEAPEHVNLRVEALKHLREGNPAKSHEALEQAREKAPAVTGTLNDKPFKSLTDCDDLLGKVLEVMAKGEYFWVPLEAVSTIAMNPPRFPRDLIWAPARLETHGGESGEVFIPALYAKSHEHQEDAIKLGRTSDWIETENGPVLGRGGRIFLIDEDSIPLLEWRELIVNGE
jgi:type VI secretion system protein ImpE